jgi:serine protease Do
MDDILLLEAIERYHNGEMLNEELMHFEQLRKSNPEIDQMVVQHIFFLNQMNTIGNRKHLHSTLDTIHADLVSQHQINNETGGKVISLLDKFRKKMAVAASVAALVGVCLFGVMFAYNKGKNDSPYDPKSFTKENESIKRDIKDIKLGLAEVKSKSTIQANTHGTGFIINENGYILTNHHVIKNAKDIYVYNEKYGDIPATLVLDDEGNDLAVLKIADTSFKSVNKIPYSFKSIDVNLAQRVYTLGYCRPPYLTYNEGFVSSKAANATLHNDKNFLLSLQVDAGNSGSPILNNNGDIIGIVSAKEKAENGFTLAVKTIAVKNIIDALQTQSKVKATLSRNDLQGLNRDVQIKKLDDYIFMIKVN